MPHYEHPAYCRTLQWLSTWSRGAPIMRLSPRPKKASSASRSSLVWHYSSMAMPVSPRPSVLDMFTAGELRTTRSLKKRMSSSLAAFKIVSHHPLHTDRNSLDLQTNALLFMKNGSGKKDHAPTSSGTQKNIQFIQYGKKLVKVVESDSSFSRARLTKIRVSSFSPPPVTAVNKTPTALPKVRRRPLPPRHCRHSIGPVRNFATAQIMQPWGLPYFQRLHLQLSSHASSR